MTPRSLVYAGLASFAVLVAGAVLADASMVVGGLLSMVVAGFLLAVKTDETSQPLRVALLEDR